MEVITSKAWTTFSQVCSMLRGGVGTEVASTRTRYPCVGRSSGTQQDCDNSKATAVRETSKYLSVVLQLNCKQKLAIQVNAI